MEKVTVILGVISFFEDHAEIQEITKICSQPKDLAEDFAEDYISKSQETCSYIIPEISNLNVYYK